MKRFQFCSIILILLFLYLSGCRQNEATLESIPVDEWPEVKKETKPWTRWWWMGNAVDKENISYLLEKYQEAGLGGVEIAPIYGAKGFEDRYLDFLSESWMEVLEFTIEKANSLEMGVDLTQGTGWPFGGPWVEEKQAASKLVIQQYEWANAIEGELDISYKKRNEKEADGILVAVMAFFPEGNFEDLTKKVTEGKLKLAAGNDAEIIAVYLAKTDQLVKRAAPGGLGFTLDHYGKESVNSYLTHFDNAFGNKLPNIRSFYNDSFEVYGSDFTEGFLKEFEKRRGYDLRPYIRNLISDEPDESGIRVKSDYRETLHELLLENFTQQWSQWARSMGKLTKNQAHGSPGNLLDLYGAVDIPECETFGSSYFPIPGLRRDSADIRNVDPDPVMLKFASSAAHLTGKNLVSCETFTWLGEHFKSSFSQMKPEVDQVFLAGVNHIFYHGVTYSPKDVSFPGWLFYASLNLTQHNSLWDHFGEFNQYITRVQSVLQAGKSDNELLVYWPVYDVWANPKGLMELISVHHIDHWLHPTEFYQQSKNLMQMGYSVDFISDEMIKNAKSENGHILPHPDSGHAKALIIPKMKYMPVETLENILKLAESGATVIFQAPPSNVPGFWESEKRNDQLQSIWNSLELEKNNRTRSLGKGKVILSTQLAVALENEGIIRESIADTGLQFIRRKIGNDKYYFIVNHGAEVISESIQFSQGFTEIIVMNPLTGSMGKLNADPNGKFPIHLNPGESIILRTTGQKISNLSPYVFRNKSKSETILKGPWELTFDQNGGPVIPDNKVMDEIQTWTSLEGENVKFYSGKGTYSGSFNIEKKEGSRYSIHFDQIHESAKIWLNGVYAGAVWSLPYELEITDKLKDGKNDIRIEVANLMANHIRYLDIHGINWRNYHEINFVNIDYKTFDASNWEVMPSGLAGNIYILGY